jgi:hypothetical protein
VQENPRKEVTSSSAPPPAIAVDRGRPKSTSPPCHDGLPKNGLLAKGLDADTQERFATRKWLNGGPEMRRIEPDVELWHDYKPGSSFSDHEVERMALNAWRYQLRKKAEYLPDRRLPDQVHLDHVKILGAALRDFKKLRIDTNMSWVECLKFQHEGYDMLGQRYGIPRDTCSARQLMDKAMDDASILLRKRCVPVNQYYSMLMVDTPGYIPSPDWNQPEKPVDKAKPRSLMHRQPKGGSTATHIKPPAEKRRSPVYNVPSYNAPSYNAPSYNAPSYNAPSYNAPSYNAPVYNDRASNTSQGGSMNPNPSSLEYLTRVTSAYLDTDRVSEKRFSNMQKNLNRGTRGPSLVGESNEDGSSCSGNENEDRDNALYDDRMVESDRKNLVDWQWQIKKIK